MKLAICTPIHDKVAAHSHVSMAALAYHCGKRGIEIKFDPPVQCSNLAHGRNMLLQEAYDWGADVAFYIDDDMVYVPEDVFRCIEYVNEDMGGGVDVVSGVYRYKDDKLTHAGHPLQDGETRGPLLEMDVVGTGFLAINRFAMERVIKDSPVYWCERTGTTIAAMFEFKKGTAVESAYGTDEKVVLFHGEDRVFSDLWRALGGRLWLATDVTVGHVGYKVWR